MIKKDYVKPSMKVVRIQQTQMICTSPGVKSVSSDEGFGWKDDGFGSDEGDY